MYYLVIIHCVVVHVVIVYLHYSHRTLNHQLWSAVKYGLTEEVVRLLGEGADPNGQDYSGRTAVHVACACNPQVLNILLQHKHININLRDNSNDTPLHLACREGSLKCVKTLIKHGADTG